MNSNQSGNQGGASAQHSGPSTTVGVGGPTSGEAGATLTHETQAETGGSGGDGLTRNEVVESPQARSPVPGSRQAAGGPPMNPGLGPPADSVRSAGDSAMNAHMRGFQDTRSEQAGASETGLGTPETGANQNEEDLEQQAGAHEKK